MAGHGVTPATGVSFSDLVQANVRFWSAECMGLNDERVGDLAQDWRNLEQAIRFGLAADESALQTAELVSRLFALVE